jgi:hypothetical protein
LWRGRFSYFGMAADRQPTITDASASSAPAEFKALSEAWAAIVVRQVLEPDDFHMLESLITKLHNGGGTNSFREKIGMPVDRIRDRPALPLLPVPPAANAGLAESPRSARPATRLRLAGAAEARASSAAVTT